MIERDTTHGSRLVGVTSTQIRPQSSFQPVPSLQSTQQQNLQQSLFHPQQQYQLQPQSNVQTQLQLSQSRMIKPVNKLFPKCEFFVLSNPKKTILKSVTFDQDLIETIL